MLHTYFARNNPTSCDNPHTVQRITIAFIDSKQVFPPQPPQNLRNFTPQPINLSSVRIWQSAQYAFPVSTGLLQTAQIILTQSLQRFTLQIEGFPDSLTNDSDHSDGTIILFRLDHSAPLYSGLTALGVVYFACVPSTPATVQLCVGPILGNCSFQTCHGPSVCFGSGAIIAPCSLSRSIPTRDVSSNSNFTRFDITKPQCFQLFNPIAEPESATTLVANLVFRPGHTSSLHTAMQPAPDHPLSTRSA